MTTALLATVILAPSASVIILFARPARDYLRAVRTPEYTESTRER